MPGSVELKRRCRQPISLDERDVEVGPSGDSLGRVGALAASEPDCAAFGLGACDDVLVGEYLGGGDEEAAAVAAGLAAVAFHLNVDNEGSTFRATWPALRGRCASVWDGRQPAGGVPL